MVRVVKGWLVFLLSIIIVDLFLATASLGKTAGNVPQPDIQFGEKTYDFGMTGQGEEVVHIFTFENVGKETLKILSLRNTCGCTAAMASSDQIPPGGSGEIKITLKTEEFQGEIKKSVYVNSNDPDESVIQLIMTGTIKPKILLRPEFINFGDVLVGEEVSKKLRISYFREDPFKADKVTVNPDYFKAEVLKVENSNDLEVKITLKKEAPVGRINEFVSISMNDNTINRNISIFGNVVSDVTISPRIISFDRINKGEKAVSKLTLTRVNHKSFKLTKAESKIKFLTINFSPLQDKQGYEIVAELDKESPAGRFQGTVDLYTDLPAEPVIQVPVQGVIVKLPEKDVYIGTVQRYTSAKVEKIKVPILINARENIIGAYSLTLHYDPHLLSLNPTDADHDSIPDAVVGNSSQFGLPAVVKIDKDKGMVKMNDYQLNPNEPGGLVPLVEVTFDIIGKETGQNFNLRLSQITIANQEGRSILSSSEQ